MISSTGFCVIHRSGVRSTLEPTCYRLLGLEAGARSGAAGAEAWDAEEHSCMQWSISVADASVTHPQEWQTGRWRR
jgi:hypothetical protein